MFARSNPRSATRNARGYLSRGFRALPRNRNRQSLNSSGPDLHARKIPMNSRGVRVPSFTVNPRVTRTVRAQGVLTNDVPAYEVTYVELAQIDESSYGSTSARYVSIRVQNVKVWLDSPPPLYSQPATGVTVTETLSGFLVSDRPVPGESLACVGMKFSLQQREQIRPVTSTDIICTITTDITLPPTSQVYFVADFIVEFN
jgi:hypothetical protein